MKIGIVGYGFVGKAVTNVLGEYHEMKIVDPAYNDNKIENDSDGYIICVPTPQSPDGSCDTSIVEETIIHCPKDKPILIKSTISLEGWRNFHEYEKSLSFSPEFLIAATALEDFKNQEYMLFGGPDYKFWKDIFPFPIIEASVEELIITKYVRNCFLATKVSLFNDIYKLCEKTNINYERVVSLTSMDRRIGSSHMQVPGPDGKMGFGGACFPKDTKAFVHTGMHFRSPMTLLNEVVALNSLIRDEDESL